MKLLDNGRYYQLPITGASIQKFVYSGALRIIFNDPYNCFLDLTGQFEVEQYNQKKVLTSKSKEALLLFYELFKVEVKIANADKFGRLYIVFENSLALTVDDGPFENWHLTRIDAKNPNNNLHVHGGVGKTIF